MPPHRRRAWLFLTVGVAIMAGTLLVQLLTPSGSSDFVVAAPAASLPSAGTPTAAADSAAPVSARATAPPAGGAASSAALIPAGVPTHVRLPRLGVQAPVDPVGLTGGELQVPEDGNRLGWWTGSVVAGSPSGSTVVDGHIDTPQGRGVFYHLKDIQADDLVVVTVAGGATLTYRVTERRTYAKADGLPPEVFGNANGSPRLVLITCGGPYDAAQATYEDNVVVTAVPA